MARKRQPFSIVMGRCTKEDGKTYHRYTVMGPAGEVMRGTRAGTRASVQKYAQGFARKLNANAPCQQFVISPAKRRAAT
ncbi:MAG: hypothetical protein OEZ16_07050 [Chromatiales bacterium]|nr:hypothetical protein [Chromatiales bacterium]